MPNFGKEVKSFIAVKPHGDVAVTSRNHLVATSQNNLSATNVYAWLHICCVGGRCILVSAKTIQRYT